MRDLSRRDDLVSWFYVFLDFALGGLPWKGIADSDQVATMKDRFDVREVVADMSPRLFEVWQYISALKWEDDPDYAMILDVLNEICTAHGINEDDGYDWAEFVADYRDALADELGIPLRIDDGADVLGYSAELGASRVVMHQLAEGRQLKSPVVRAGPANYSIVHASEMDESDVAECCCCSCC
jgi:hypothetical protein